MAPLSQHTAALCGRLGWRRGNGLAADDEPTTDPLHIRPLADGASSDADMAVVGKRAFADSTGSMAASRGEGRHAATDCGDGHLVVDVDLVADMARVQQLVGEICCDLERGSPQPNNASSPSGQLHEVCPVTRLLHVLIFFLAAS